jgi:maltooligosyltrehalose trehalohydrolase
VLASDAFVLRYLLDGADDRLLIVNLGRQVGRASIAEPLIAPPRGCDWEIEWSSEEPIYGGFGTPDLWPEDRWCLPSESAIVLRAVSARDPARTKVARRTA